MPRYVAFLRGINLGRRRLRMDRLRELFEELGFTGVETYIASGNVLFEDRGRDSLKLAGRIAAHLAARLGYEVDTFVRTRAEIAALAAQRPFSTEEMTAPENTVHVGFFAEAPTADQTRGLMAAARATGALHVAGRDFVWLIRRGGMSDANIWATPAVRALRLPSSSIRNLKTIRALAEIFLA